MNKSKIIVKEVRQELFEHQDKEYRKFLGKIIPNISYDRIIGVRTPILKKMAKEIYNEKEVHIFLTSLPHYYYEENQLHGKILNLEKDFDQAIEKVETLLPFMDNWALTDGLLPKAFLNNPDPLFNYCKRWIQTGEEYIARYGVFLMMRIHLKGEKSEEAISFVSNIKVGEYYLKMMVSWFFAEALLYQEDLVFSLLEKNVLDTWIHNKAIQKARESRRTSIDLKEKLQKMKR